MSATDRFLCPVLKQFQALLRRNAKVYITSRDRERGQHAVDRLRIISEKIHILPLDLSDLHSVRRAAREFMRREKYLHVLVNNAGVMCPPTSLFTHQRYDLQFGVNVLGHFYLTRLLLPILLATAKAVAHIDRVRVVHYTCALPSSIRIDFTTLMDGPMRRQRTATELYQQSKLGDLLFAMELADQYADQGIDSLVVNPGNVYTELTRHSNGVSTALLNMLSSDVSKGVIAPLFAATAPHASKLNDKIIGPWARAQDVPASLTARCAGETLWDWLSAQTECFEIVNGVGREGAAQEATPGMPGWRAFSASEYL